MFPTTETEAFNPKLNLRPHFVALSRQQLAQRGFSEYRTQFALAVQSLVFGVIAALVTAAYSLYVFAILAAEQHIYDSSRAAVAVESVELLFMALFALEVVVYVAAFGPTLYFGDVLNAADVALVLLTVVWYVLDLSDADRFRQTAAFRVIRVALMLSRLRFAYFAMHARLRHVAAAYDVETPASQVCGIIGGIRDHITDSKLASDLSYCLDVIASGRLYHAKDRAAGKDGSETARSTKRESRRKPSIDYVKKVIQKTIDKVDLK